MSNGLTDAYMDTFKIISHIQYTLYKKSFYIIRKVYKNTTNKKYNTIFKLKSTDATLMGMSVLVDFRFLTLKIGANRGFCIKSKNYFELPLQMSSAFKKTGSKQDLKL